MEFTFCVGATAIVTVILVAIVRFFFGDPWPRPAPVAVAGSPFVLVALAIDAARWLL